MHSIQRLRDYIDRLNFVHRMVSRGNLQDLEKLENGYTVNEYYALINAWYEEVELMNPKDKKSDFPV